MAAVTSANWKDLLSVDVGGHEVVAILEKDGKQEEASMDTVRVESNPDSGRRVGSPGRMFKVPGKED